MKYLTSISKSEYLKQIFSLASGTALAQLITLGSYLIITRLFSPNELGEFKFLESAAFSLAIIATLSYEHAIILPKKRKQALGILKIACVLVFVTFLGCIFFWGIWRIIGYPFTNNTHLLLIFCAMALISGINIFSNWFISQKQFLKLSIARIFQSFSTSILQIVFGFFSIGSFGLMIGYLSGRLISLLYLVCKAGITLKDITQHTISELKKIVRKYIDQPKYILPSKLIQQIAVEIPFLLTPFLFDDYILGMFALAIRALATPTQFLGVSVGQVYYKQISERVNEKKSIVPLLLKTWGGLTIISIIPFGLLLFIGESIFMLVFGADWQDAGKIASIMAPALFLYFIIGPTERASFLALNLQHKALLFSIIDLIGKSTAMITGYFIGDFFMCIQLMTVAQATTTVLIAFTILSQSRKTDARLNEHHN